MSTPEWPTSRPAVPDRLAHPLANPPLCARCGSGAVAPRVWDDPNGYADPSVTRPTPASPLTIVVASNVPRSPATSVTGGCTTLSTCGRPRSAAAPGRTYYDLPRTAGDFHPQAPRAQGNRLVGSRHHGQGVFRRPPRLSGISTCRRAWSWSDETASHEWRIASTSLRTASSTAFGTSPRNLWKSRGSAEKTRRARTTDCFTRFAACQLPITTSPSRGLFTRLGLPVIIATRMQSSPAQPRGVLPRTSTGRFFHGSEAVNGK